jgi:hypothetical protein
MAPSLPKFDDKPKLSYIRSLPLEHYVFKVGPKLKGRPPFFALGPRNFLTFFPAASSKRQEFWGLIGSIPPPLLWNMDPCPSGVVFAEQVLQALAKEVLDGAVRIGREMFEAAVVARIYNEGHAPFSRSRGCKVYFGRRRGWRLLYRWHIARRHGFESLHARGQAGSFLWHKLAILPDCQQAGLLSSQPFPLANQKVPLPRGWPVHRARIRWP